MLRIKLYSSFFILFAIGLSSCRQSYDIRVADYPAGQKLLSTITAIDNYDARKTAYGGLNGTERFNLWYAKLENAIQSGVYTNQQEKAISQLRDKLAPNLFAEGDAKEVFHNVWLPEWIKKSGELFTPIQIYNMVFAINKADFMEDLKSRNGINKLNNSAVSFDSEGGGSSTCFCKIGSAFTCYKIILTPPYVEYGICTLTSGTSCVQQPRECGPLLDETCDGNHCSNL